MINKNSKIYNWKRFILNVSMFIYILLLLKIILFKDIPINSIIRVFNKGFKGFRSLNLIPFISIINMFNDPSIGVIKIVINIMGNIAVFIPTGIILKTKYEGLSLREIVYITVAISVSFEIIQFLLKIGVSDIDDVILNSLGGFLGVSLVDVVRKRNSKFSLEPLLISIIMIFLVAILLYDRIGFSNEKINIVNENEYLLSDLTKGTENYLGKIVSVNEEDIEVILELSKDDVNSTKKEGSKKINVNNNTNIIVGTIMIKNGVLGNDELHTFYKQITINELDKLAKENEVLPIRIWSDEDFDEDIEGINAHQILITLHE